MVTTVYFHLPSFIIMEFISTEKRARAIVYEGHKDILNWLGYREVTAAVGLSALFRKILFHRNTAITILQVRCRSREYCQLDLSQGTRYHLTNTSYLPQENSSNST